MAVKNIAVLQQPTKEEMGLVKLLAFGLNGEEMAKQASLTQPELARTLTTIRTKYNCKNSTELVAYFLRNKLIN